MAKFVRKTKKNTISRKKTRKNIKSRAKASENVDSLLELHRLQGVLLAQLRRDI